MRAHGGARVATLLLVVATGCATSRTPSARAPVSTTEVTSAAMPLPANDAAPAAGTMRGLFRYQADAATFEDCATGTRYPVAMEGGYLDVERAYSRAMLGRQAGSPLVVTVRGRVETRPRPDLASGDGAEQNAVIVEALLASGDDPRGCEETLTSDLKARLTASRWILVELDGTPIAPSGTDMPTPSLVFVDDGTDGVAVTGFTGCNSFRGHATPQAVGASATVGTLGMADVGSTRRACSGDRMTAESSLLRVLTGAERLELVGGTLVVTGGGGHVARFQMETK